MGNIAEKVEHVLERARVVLIQSSGMHSHNNMEEKRYLRLQGKCLRREKYSTVRLVKGHWEKEIGARIREA